MRAFTLFTVFPWRVTNIVDVLLLQENYVVGRNLNCSVELLILKCPSPLEVYYYCIFESNSISQCIYSYYSISIVLL